MNVTVRDDQPVRVAVYDVQGCRIQGVHSRALSGHQTRRLQIDTEGLSSGTYFVRVQGRAFAETRRLTVVK